MSRDSNRKPVYWKTDEDKRKEAEEADRLAGLRIQVHPDPVSRAKIFRSIAETGWLQVWEGSVRSSKTFTALIAFLCFVNESPDTAFIMSGKTLGTLERNVIYGDYGLLNIYPGSVYKSLKNSNVVMVPTAQGWKTVYCFGAGDASSFGSLRGVTVGGWYADEINLHHRTFVDEAFSRTIVSHMRKHFWTLNPDNPHHWIYTDFIDKYDFATPEEKEAMGGFHLWHFTLHDNPVLTQKTIDELKLQYHGYAYDRYILGIRCVAEGLIYPKVNDDMFIDFDRSKCQLRYCALDFGVDHPTTWYIGGPYDGDRHDWRICYEYFDEKSDKTTGDYLHDFMRMCEDIGINPYSVMIAIDPAAGAIKKEFQKAGLQAFNARNDVLDGINYTRNLIYSGKLKFHRSCRNARREFSTYAWDEKASERGEDKPIKVDDDCMDAIRYLAYTHIRPVLGG